MAYTRAHEIDCRTTEEDTQGATKERRRSAAIGCARIRCVAKGSSEGHREHRTGREYHLRTVSGEGRKPSQELKKNNAKRPPIDAKAVLLSQQNLGRQVLGGAHNVLASPKGLGGHLRPTRAPPHAASRPMSYSQAAGQDWHGKPCNGLPRHAARNKRA